MKKTIMAMTVIAAAFIMGSCAKEQIDGTAGSVIGNDIITAFSEENLTKTALEGNGSTFYDVVWSAGDKIKIGDNIFTLIDGEGTTKGTFQGTLPKDGTYTAYYPETSNGGWSGNYIYAGSSISGAPMTSEVTISDGKVAEPLKFTNSGGILRLTLRGNATIRTIALYGDGSRVLSCGGGVALDNTDGKVFYIPMRPKKYTYLTIHFYTIDGLDIVKKLKSGKFFIIERKEITDMSFSGINSTAPQGVLPGEFSVAEGCKVHFSKGNLRYTVDSGKWSFFDRQYDCGPSNYEDGHNKEISLFTWGCGSWSTSTDTKEYLSGFEDGTDFRITQDWGSQVGESGTWRTLTSAEWEYLFKTRTDAEKKYGLATVCGVKGLIILPDTFTDPMKNKGDGAFKPKTTMSWTDNLYTGGGDWEWMEYAGAVFLPAAGYRDGENIYNVDASDMGYYWSSSAYPDKFTDYSRIVTFYESGYFGLDHHGRQYGSSVRPVTGSYTVTYDLNGVSGTTPQSIEGLLYGSFITKPADSPAAKDYTFTGWFKEAECRNQWDFTKDRVTANTKLYAGWAGGLIPGKFTVNAAGKQVYFSMGNLWADGSNALHFEEHQYSFNNSYSSSHVSHFTWSESPGQATGTSGAGDYLFCDEDHRVSVNGSSPIYYALTKDEWTYLLNLDGHGRTIKSGQKPTYTTGIRYSDGTVEKEGLVIYPDDYSGDSLTPGEGQVYTEETFPEDCVFLPGAGWRDGKTIMLANTWNGFYWSSSAETGQEIEPYNLELTSEDVGISEPGNANSAMSIRLVTTVE